MTIPILYDCDPGHDDAIALVMACRSPDIDLVGVTTTCGNATIERTTANALRVLDFLGADHIPVAQGCARPLARPLVLGTADGPSGMDGTPYLPAPSREPIAQHAVDFLAHQLEQAPDPIIIVATGPLSNIGFMVLKYPHLLAKIKKLVWMGGVFYRKSDIITATEFNAFCDPEALKIVLESGIAIEMIGLDVTMQVLVETHQYQELAKIDTPLGKLVMDWLRFYEKLHRNLMGIGGALHDPLALAVVIDPDLVRMRPAHIGVELGGDYALGATVADFWHERGLADNAQIAYEVDSQRFFNLLFDLLR